MHIWVFCCILHLSKTQTSLLPRVPASGVASGLAVVLVSGRLACYFAKFWALGFKVIDM